MCNVKAESLTNKYLSLSARFFISKVEITSTQNSRDPRANREFLPDLYYPISWLWRRQGDSSVRLKLIPKIHIKVPSALVR